MSDLPGRPKSAPGLAPAQWYVYALDCEERIAELEEERDQWQESSGQNYVRATEAEMLCDRADEIMARYRHEAEVDRLRIAQLEAGLYRIRDFDTDTPGPAMQDIARQALKESDE